jgi:hypothetical protein
MQSQNRNPCLVRTIVYANLNKESVLAIKASAKRMDQTFARMEHRQQSILSMLNSNKLLQRNTDHANNTIARGNGMNAAHVLNAHAHSKA